MLIQIQEKSQLNVIDNVEPSIETTEMRYKMKNQPNIVPMAQGYMKLECIPEHEGAHWRSITSKSVTPGFATWNNMTTTEPTEYKEIDWTDFSNDAQYSEDNIPYWLHMDSNNITAVEDNDDLPIYIQEWPASVDNDNEGVLYWNFFSIDGITDPYLIKYAELDDLDKISQFEADNLIGVWGTNSYRTVTTPDTGLAEYEIP